MWVPEIGDFLSNAARGRALSSRSIHFLRPTRPIAVSLSTLKRFPTNAQPGFKALIAALYDDFHPRNLRLYVNTPVGDDDWDLKFMADHSDGLLLMNYDEHQDGGEPGPIASQDWFLDNLKQVLKTVPKEKVICSLGSYGYDWTTSLPPETRRQARAKKKARSRKGTVVAQISRPRRHGRRRRTPTRRSTSTTTRSTCTLPTTTSTRTSATRSGFLTRSRS